MIQIFIENVFSKIIGLNHIKAIDEIDDKLSYFVPGYQFSKAFKSGYYDKKTDTWITWDGKKKLLSKDMKFQSGLLPYVEEIIKKYNLTYQIIDNRKNVILGKEIILNKNYYTPRDYQIDILNACLKHKNGVVKSATGSGKSYTMAMLIGKTNIKTVIYVPGITLLYQLKETLETALGIEVGLIGDGHCEIKKITIATTWSVSQAYGKEYEPFDDEEKHKVDKLSTVDQKKIVKMVEECEMFIIDEGHHVACSSAQVIAQSSKNARYRFIFSGTPWRDDDDDILLEAVSGVQLADVSASLLIEKQVLVPPKIHFLNVPESKVKFNKNYQEVYSKYIVENDERNDMINSSIVGLYDKGRRVLVLIKRKKHGQIILDNIPSHINALYLDGDASSEEREDAKSLIKNKQIDVIISSAIFDQGIDIPELDALILGGGGKSSTRALQRIGRVIRGCQTTNKKDAIVVDFIDNAPYLLNHSKKRYKIYKTEPQFIIKLPNK